MRIYLLILFGLMGLLAVVASEFRTVFTKHIPVPDHAPVDALDHSQHFVHSQHFLDALKNRQPLFEVLERVDPESSWSLLDYMDMSTKAEYDSQAIYTLHTASDSYFNLDTNPDVEADFADQGGGVQLCSTTATAASAASAASIAAIRPGSYLVGTANGAWAQGARAQQWLEQLHGSAKPHDNLVVQHQVLSAAAVSGRHGCTLLKTRWASHLDLFSKVRVISIGSHPFLQMVGRAEDLEDVQRAGQRRREQSTSFIPKLSPDMKSCTALNFPGLLLSFGDLGLKGYELHMGAHLGCAEYKQSLGQFSANWNDQLKKAATSSLPMWKGQSSSLADSITCQECYAYIGAGFVVEFTYSLNWNWFSVSPKSIQIEAKIGGGAGFNFAMLMDLSKDRLLPHIVTPLLPPNKLDRSINIGAGLSLSYGFGGLTAEIISSGNATGKATIGATAAANLEYGIRYSYGSKPPFRFLNSTGFTFTPPYFQLNGARNSATGAQVPFALSKFSVTGFLRSTQDFSVNYNAIIGSVGVGFSLSQTGVLTFADGKLSYALKNSIVKVPPINAANPSDDTPRELEAAHALEASIASPSQSPRPVFRAGDSIPFSVSYSGYPESAPVTFFFSIVVPNGQEYMIVRHVATTSSTGAGNVSVEYVVPWDELYASSGLQGSGGDFFVNVRSSSLVTRVVSTEAFGIESFTADDGMVGHTVDASRGYSPDAVYELSWRPELLSFYQRSDGAEFHGAAAQSRAVNIDLVLEVLARNGTQLGTQSYPLQRRVVNSGRGVVRIPLNATRAAEGRAYFVVTSVEYSNIKSWSKGYVVSSGRVGAGLGLGLGAAKGARALAAGTGGDALEAAAQELAREQAELQRRRRELVDIASLVCDYASNQPGAFISGVLNSIVVLGIDIGIPLRPMSIPVGVANAVCMAATGSGAAPGVPMATALPSQAPTAFPPGQSLVCAAGKSFDGTRCSLCPPGYYSLGGVGVCSPCSGGTYAPAVGSSTCAPCPAGTYSGAFASSCDSCRPGYFADSAQPRCGLCQAGTFSEVGSAVCLPCANGQFSLPGSSNCQACS